MVELIVYRSLRCPSSVHPSMFSSNFSEDTGPIKLKIDMDAGTTVFFPNGLGHVI